MVRPWLIAMLLFAIFVVGEVGAPAPAEAVCPTTTLIIDSLVRTCWECMFPLSVFGVTLTSFGEDMHLPAIGPGLAALPPQLCGCVCILPGVCIPGIPLGIWEPKNLVEVVRTPFCFPTLTGYTAGSAFAFTSRGVATSQQDEGVEANYHFYHVHYFAFPLWAIVGLALDIGCLNYTGMYDDLDLLYLTEVDPLWRDDILATFFYPEAFLINNPISQAACAADALAAAVTFPIDALWWCSGSWGSLYPVSGNISGSAGGDLKPAALSMARVLNRLARVGMELWTSANGPLICHDYPTFQIVKGQYKFELMYPIPNIPPNCCSPIGRTLFRWGLGKQVPAIGEDYVFLLWKLQRCCML
ncbi:MAG: hypothetical protein D6690_12400 [Nitrospirae bacterium]|nr:MAG: hypothetical protein D6690_12400 [Nitrospirota bacterium]